MKKIGVFGGGSWGRALAFAFSFENEVKIYSRRKIEIPSRNLPTYTNSQDHFAKDGHSLPISPSHPITQADLDEVLECDYYVIAIASFALRQWLEETFIPAFKKHQSYIQPKILCASKGVEEGSGAFVSDIFQHFFPSLSLCFLSGPSFAKEILQELPCALVINSLNIPLAREFRELMPSFIKTYVSPDIVGGEIAGAYKNVIAIAGGIADGLALGNNAKSSLLARGLVEMCRFGEHFGAKMETFLGLSGAGDLFLTSSSTLSRNYRVGLGLAQGKGIAEILKDLGEVAEGVRSARAIAQIGKKEGIYTPIATEVQNIIEGKNPLESLKALMK